MATLISVIVPVLNSGSYLAPCLNSIAAQTHRDLQVLLVDDGSTDGSAELCAEYARRDPRFICLHHERGGVSAARGAGFARAEGDYIAFADSDDLLHPEMLSTLLRAAQSTGADLACCRYDTFCETPPPEEPAPTRFLLLNAPEHQKALLRDHRVDFGLWNKLYRRGLLTAEHFARDIRFNEDLLANWMVFSALPRIALADFAGYHYRQNQQSATRKTLAARNPTDQQAVARQICADAAGGPLEGFCEAWYFEKLLYLYSLILRRDNAAEYAERAADLQREIRRTAPAALRYKELSAGLKGMGLLAAGIPGGYRLLCRLLLRNRQ